MQFNMSGDDFESGIHEAMTALRNISLFNYALLAIMSYLVSTLALALLGFGINSFYLSLVPTTAVVALTHVRNRRTSRPVKEIEKGNPMLRERLSTAYDNRQSDNIIVNELIKEVCYELKNINMERYVDIQRTNTYIGVSIIAVFLLLILLLSDFGRAGLPGFSGHGWGASTGEGESNLGDGSGGGGGAKSGETVEPVETTVAGLGTLQSIYGDSSIAKIEGEDLKLEIHPAYGEGGEISTEEDTNLQTLNEIKDNSAQATAAESYVENIPIELESVVKGYFEKLAEE